MPVPRMPHRYRRTATGERRCVVSVCGLILPANLFDRAGRCPRCARLHQCQRHARNDRNYRARRRERAHQEALPRICAGLASALAREAELVYSETRARGKAPRPGTLRKRISRSVAG